MSSILQPSGPLSPRVYWTRRLVLLLAVVLMLAVVWWLIGKATASGESGSPTHHAGTTTPGPGSPRSTKATSSTPATPKHHPNRHHPNRHHRGNRPSGTHHRTNHHEGKPGARQQPPATTTLAKPTGPCDPTAVTIQVKVADRPTATPGPIRLMLTSARQAACTLTVTPDNLLVEITSGPDHVWSSEDCPDAITQHDVVVRSATATPYTLSWDGFRSVKQCRNTGAMAKPGGYWVNAAFLGGEPARGYFDVVKR